MKKGERGRRTLQRAVSLLLALIMILTLVPTDISAQNLNASEAAGEVPGTNAEGTEEASGTKPEGTEEASGTKPEGTEEVPGTKPEGTEEVPGTKPEGTEEVPETKPEGTEEVPETKPEGTEKVPGTKPEGTEEVPETKPEGTEEVPETKPEGTEEVPETKPGENGNGSAETPEKNESDEKTEQPLEPQDWSGNGALRFALHVLEETEAELWYRMGLRLYWDSPEEQPIVQTGDTLSFGVPEEWLFIEDTQEPVLVYAGELGGMESEEAVLREEPVAEYTAADNQVELRLLEGAEEIEDIRSVFLELELAVRWERKALTEAERQEEWTIQSAEDGSEQKLLLTLPAREQVNWAERKENFYWEIKETENEDGSGSAELTLGFYVENEDVPVLAGDTAEIPFISETRKLAETPEPIPVYTGEGEERREIASCLTEGQTVKLTFTEGIEEAAPLTEVKGTAVLAFAEPEEKNEMQAAALYAAPAPPAKDGTLGSLDFGGTEVQFTKKDYETIAQQIWWVDNNDTNQRYNESAYKDLFCGKGGGSLKAVFTYTEDGAEKTREAEFNVANLIESGVLSADDISVVSYQGGYQLSVAGNALPAKGYYEENGKKIEGSFTWTMNPPKSTNHDIDGYYFVNVENPKDFTDLSIEPGWYYIKNQPFTVHVQIRRGDAEQIDDAKLQAELNKQLHFFYKEKSGDTDYRKVSLEELLKDSAHDTRITWKKVPSDGVFDDYKLTIHNLPLYRVDGLENIYYVMNDNGDSGKDDTIIDLGLMTGGTPTYEKGGDYLKITYENDLVGNFGSVIDKAHSGGTVIMTLMGRETYAATKAWMDESDKSDRPALEFRLWRYTKGTKEDGTAYTYRDASPVKNAAGEIVKINIPAGNTEKDKIKLSFYEAGITDAKGNAGIASPGLGYLDAAKTTLEYLPKFNPEGFEYVYFVREEMTGGGSYEQIFGEIKETNGTLTVTDTLPEGVTRDDTDKSIYNDGTVSNRLDAGVRTGVEKRWEAAAFQDSFQDVKVEVKLQSRPKGSTDDTGWTDVTEQDSDGTQKPVTKRIAGFKAEHLVLGVGQTADKYDLLGRELEYRWVETAIYQGEEGKETEISIDEASRTFTLTQGGKQVQYRSETEAVYETDGEYKTRIVNRLQDQVNYIVEKEWEPELQPEPIYVRIQQKDYQGRDNLILEHDGVTAMGLPLDGQVDGAPVEATGWCTDGTSFTFTYQEVKSWRLEIEGLPKYSASGHIYDYMAFENMENHNWRPSYATEWDKETNTYKTVITNAPTAKGKGIYVQKEWIDDSDVEHREPVTVTVYEYEEGAAGDKYHPYKEGTGKKYEAVLNTGNFWWSKIALEADADLSKLFIVETKVGEQNMLQAGENGGSLYTQENLKDIYESQKSNTDISDPIVYTGKNHYYSQHYNRKMVAGHDFYTVTNQRLGLIDLTVTKYWADGNGEKRAELKEELEKKGYGLYLRLSSVEYPEAVNYVNDTVWVSQKVDPVPLPILDKDGKSAAGLQEIAIENADTDADEKKYYFHNLPKYDIHGAVIHYVIEEVVLEKSAVEAKPGEGAAENEIKAYNQQIRDAKTFNAMKGDYADKGTSEEDAEKIYTEYTSTVTEHEYVVGEYHSEDTQAWDVTNRPVGVKSIKFYKQWKDAYRNETGHRPDITLDIYQLNHKKTAAADGTGTQTEWGLSPYYKDYKWEKLEAGLNDVWELTLTDLPKYDAQGYEIFYYGQEVIVLNNSAAFDYVPVYYKHTGYITAEQPPGTTVIGDEQGVSAELSEDLKKKIKATDVTKPAEGENAEAEALLKADGIHLLKEGGTFVNQVKEDVRIEGKKLWRLGGNQIPDTEWPEVTFALYQKTSEAGRVPDKPSDTGSLVDADGKPVIGADGKTPLTYKKVAFVTISDWSTAKKNGTYGFAMQYQGENTYKIAENGEPEITGENGAPTIPQYDEDGKLYYYEVRETLTETAGGDWENVYKQPEINNYMVTNVYEPEKDSLTVRKFVVADLDKQGTNAEKYPSVSFTLTRKYQSKDDASGTPTYVLDPGFSRTKTIKWSEFKKEEGESAGKAETTFEDLEVYAPNGTKYQYIVTENEDEIKGYTVYWGEGLIDTAEEVKQEGATTDGISLDKTTEEAVTFKNVHEPEPVILKGEKEWQDNENAGDTRPPFVDENNPYLTFTVHRQAGKGMPDNIFINWMTVDQDKYDIEWEKKADNVNIWTYKIVGKDGELERYAPNGYPWEYRVEEVLAEPYKSYYNAPNGAGQVGTSEEDGQTYININRLQNKLHTEVYAIKEWELYEPGGTANNPDSCLIKSEYQDYVMEVVFKLQARVDGIYTKNLQNPVEPEVRSEWQDAGAFFSKLGYDNLQSVTNASEEQTTGKHTFADAEAKRKVYFRGLLHAVSAKEDVSDIEIKKGNIVQIKYRAVEKEIRYYKKGATPADYILLYTQTMTLKNVTDDIPTYQDSDVNGLSMEVTQEGKDDKFGYTTVWVTNTLPTVVLRVWKNWIGDEGYQQITRPNAEQDASTVYFVIQRREKGVDEDAWENVKIEKGGETEDYVWEKTIPNTTVGSKGEEITIQGLTKYNWILGENNTPRLVEYEYRAREIAFDADRTDGIQEEEILQESDYTGLYQVEYDAGYPVDQEDSSALQPVKAQVDYTTKVQNIFRTVDLYAEKDWRDKDANGDPEITVPVTLKVQYLSRVQKTDANGDPVTNPDGSPVYKTEWVSVPGDTGILLNGEADTDQDKFYREYEAWKACWKLPQIMPDSETIGVTVTGSDGTATTEQRTQYRVVEVTDTSYPAADRETAELESGTGTEDDPYVFTFNTSADGSAGNPYKLTDAPTELKISKTVSGGSKDDNFTFTIGAASDTGKTAHASYQKYKRNTDPAAGGDVKKGDLTTLDLSGGNPKSFTLKHDEYLIVYGLVRNASYTITETGIEGGSAEALSEYETTVVCTGVTDSSNPPTADPRTSLTVITPNAKPDTVPEVAFTNSKGIVGSITIEKKDEEGKAMEGVIFRLKWRVKGDTSDTEFKELTEKVCGNPELLKKVTVDGTAYIGIAATNADGKAVFDQLILPNTGSFEYQITELKTKDGYNLLANPIVTELPYVTAIKADGSKPYKEETVDTVTKYYYKDITITIENNHAFVMPSTSGSGFFWPGVMGMTILFAGGGYYVWKEERRRRKRRKVSR